MSTRPLKLEDPHNLLWPYVPSYRAWFEARGYGDKQVRRYTAAVLHFGTWARSRKLDLARLGETEVSRFLHVHLRHCRCPKPVTPDLNNNRSALGHLFRHLRDLGVVSDAPPKPLALEMAAFDRRMNDVWGMTPQTRAHRRMVARRLLEAVSCCDPVDISKLTPRSIRAFVTGDGHRPPATVGAMAGAVRCYLRHRTLLGDDVSHLLRAVPKPTAWKTGALPQVLTIDELDTLLRAFEDECPSRRRGYAIVRCLVDMGLRSSEVIRLRLEDIDWEAGVVRLAVGKNRRGAMLPLPKVTGEAIVDYLLHERPQTEHREIFVRHITPKGGPVGRRVVQRTLHAAYKRLGWERTRVHVLRHTLGSRLINSGSSIKQIADVLRHKSIETAARYVRVDRSRLSAVVSPWPGDVA